MADDDAVRFGELAVERGYLSPAQLASALADLGKRRDARRLGALLVDREQLTSHQALEIDALLQAREAAAARGRELIGVELGGCRILDQIGEGSMGTTYRAHHARLDRIVALKVLHPRLVAIEGNLERFTREAQAAATLEHPGIVQVYDFDADQGYHFIVMQYVEGQNLRELLGQRGPFGPRRALWIGARVLEGLAHAHARGLVHRDIKPANLLLTREPQIKIADFGLVRILTLTTSERISMFGEIIGTPLYMPPEQATCEEVDGRADLYALGISLFELICGRVPFPGETTMEVLEQHCLRPFPKLAELAEGITPQLQGFLERMCAKDVEDRYASAEQALEALRELRQGVEHRRGGVEGSPDPSRQLEAAPALVNAETLTGLRMRLGRLRLGGGPELLDQALAGIALNQTPAETARAEVEAALRLERGADKAVTAILARLLGQGQVDELLALAPRIEARLPTTVGVAFYVGQALARHGHLDEAAARLALATVLAPDHLPARLHLARTLVAVGRAEDAVETLREATAWHPASELLARRLAELLWIEQADAAAAVPAFERAVELNPRRTDLRLQLALALCELGRLAEAVAVLQEGLAWASSDETLRELLRCVRDQLSAQRARRATSETLPVDDEEDLDTHARLDAIRLAEASGRWQRALDVSNSGLEENPRSVLLLLAQGRAQAMLGDHASALESYGLALAIDPGNAAALEGLRASQRARREDRDPT